MRPIDEITGAVLDAAIKIHTKFGPGMLESVYERMLAAALKKRGFVVETQKDISFEYDGMSFENAFRVDMLVDGLVVVELTSTEKNAPVFHKQLKTYLKVLDLQVGLLINFGMATLKEGFSRVVNDFDPTDSTLRINNLRSAPSVESHAEARGEMFHAETRRGGDDFEECGISGGARFNPNDLRLSSSPREVISE